jgi:hypothetical protein
MAHVLDGILASVGATAAVPRPPPRRAAPMPWCHLLRAVRTARYTGPRHAASAPCVRGCGPWGHHATCRGACIAPCVFVEASALLSGEEGHAMRGYSVCLASGRLHYCCAAVDGSACDLGLVTYTGAAGGRAQRCWMSGHRFGEALHVCDTAEGVPYGELKRPDTRRSMLLYQPRRRRSDGGDRSTVLGPRCRRRRIVWSVAAASLVTAAAPAAPRDRSRVHRGLDDCMGYVDALVEGPGRVASDRPLATKFREGLHRRPPRSFLDLAARAAAADPACAARAWAQRDRRYRALSAVAEEGAQLYLCLREGSAAFQSYQCNTGIFLLAYLYTRMRGHEPSIGAVYWIEWFLPSFERAVHILRRGAHTLSGALTHHMTLLHGTLEVMTAAEAAALVSPRLRQSLPLPLGCITRRERAGY